MIRILHCVSDGNVGGAGITLSRLVSSVDKSRFEIACAIPYGSKLTQRISCASTDVFYYNAPADQSFSLKSVFEFVKIIRVFRPHIVHTHGCVSARLAAFLCGVRSRIYTAHTYAVRNPLFFLQFVNNLITTKAIAVSPALVSQVAASGVKLDKISVIYNGCEDMIKYSPKFCNENERSMTVLYHGRVTKEKGLDCAVKAIRILSDNNVDVRLTIVGDGEYKRELEAYSEALGVRNNIKFLPYIEDIKECINTSDVILNASLFAEGTSNSVIEGMSAKRAVILSDVEGNVCLSSNGKYGVLFNKGDAQDLSRAIMQIYENKSEYKKMSDAARMGYEEHYTLKRMTDEYEKVWEREYEKRYKD